MNNDESNNELKNLMTNIEKFEKEIKDGTNGENHFSKEMKKINETNFANQSSDELANNLKIIDEEIDGNEENNKLEKNITLNEIFLCPKCLKKYHYLFHSLSKKKKMII